MLMTLNIMKLAYVLFILKNARRVLKISERNLVSSENKELNTLIYWRV